jgi:uncharacterized membrane protein
MYWIGLLGIVTGMRTMTGIAVVCWMAYLGYLPVQGTWAFWTAKLASVIVFTLLALGEYVGDTLPRTPNRTSLFPALARLSFAILVGLVIATVLDEPLAGGVVLGAVGALIGTYGGYRARMFGARVVGRDLPVALFESALAVGLAVTAILHTYMEIIANANPPVLQIPH